jgi:CBS-domain-containing membrane protein
MTEIEIPVSSAAIEEYAREPVATGSYRSPSFEHALVRDAMTHGIVSVRRDTEVREIARLMTNKHIHSVIVWEGGRRGCGIVSDFDLVLAARDDLTLTAGSLACGVSGIREDASLAAAADLMREQRTTHLVVLSAATRRPMGMISALDVVGITAWGEA